MLSLFRAPSGIPISVDTKMEDIQPAEAPSVPTGMASQESSALIPRLSRNMIFSLARVLVNALVSLVLPSYLTHHLPVATYGAWVLILQMASFVSFLDFGVQAGVAKFVAEHEARGDEVRSAHYASAGLAVMTLTGSLGVLLTLVLAWQVPRLFHAMPASLYHDVRISVILIGTTLSFGLVCSVFSAVFMGLQRYAVPAGTSIINRTLFAVAVLTTALLHGNLAEMGAAAALINIFTGCVQIFAWKKMAFRIKVSFSLVEPRAFREMVRYCSALAIWTAGMICVSGLDITIIGHYAFSETGYYAIAVLPVNFITTVASSMLGPMMPASSAMSTRRSASEMGSILNRATCYCTLLLLISGLALIIFGFPVLRLWVGLDYAVHSITYLRILVVANLIRNLFMPYSIMVMATGRMRAAIGAAVGEASVNLGSSLYLASHFGAIGVAIGTLLGSLVSVSLHLVVSMYRTRDVLETSRSHFLFAGVLRPAATIFPSLFFLTRWAAHSEAMPSLGLIVLWGASTLLILWFVSLNRSERKSLLRMTRRLRPVTS
jgi:O-antigen/teichoic acid export membrane protein